MGSIAVFLAGTFRQTLPVILSRTWANEIQTCNKASNQCPQTIKFLLIKNIRVHLRRGVTTG